jgi:flavorubredoxin
MKAQQIKDGVYWVGAIDWNLRNFHGYETPRGSTYNAYLIMGEKIALIDTVKHYCAEEMLERIASVVDPAKIDYLISNHVEMDHSGAIPQLLKVAPKATVVTCAAGEKGLREHFHADWHFQMVKSGDRLELGGRTLSFLTTPMVHWPDNMVTYLIEDGLLFSNDAFGQHYASPERFDDELPLHLVMEQAQKYYGNIVLCYQSMVAKALESAAGLKIEMIAPSHGLIWRKQVGTILDHYRRWTTNQTEQQALIIYDTMWGSTEKLAHTIAGAFENRGIRSKLFNLQASHISEIMTEVVTSRYLCVGSPTLNGSILPTVAAFLTYLKSLSPKKRVALAFGSYGWGGQSVDQVQGYLKDSGFELMEPVKTKYVPDKEALSAIRAKVEQMIDGFAQA